MDAVTEMPAPLAFSDSAANKVKQLIEEEGNPDLKLRAVSPLRDEVLDELVRELDRLAHRHAEADEVFGVHVLVRLKMVTQRTDTLRVRSGVCSFLSKSGAGPPGPCRSFCGHRPRARCRPLARPG